MKSAEKERVRDVASFWVNSSSITNISSLGEGNINETYLVSYGPERIVLQRISSAVFVTPIRVVENAIKVSDHLSQCTGIKTGFPQILKTIEGGFYITDQDGEVWRAQNYFEGATTFLTLQSPKQGYEIGKHLALFHQSVSDVPPSLLTITITDFHNLPVYLERYKCVQKEYRGVADEMLLQCYETVDRFKKHAHYLEESRVKGKVHTSIIHGDPKVSNFLFDTQQRVIAIIDPDTVGPGLKLYDIGDCLRSSCSRVLEGDSDNEAKCDIDIVKAVLEGYMQYGKLSAFEKASLVMAHFLITFELGVRFLTDYLQGNVYFRVENEKDNLRKAAVQLALARSIDEQREKLQSIVNSIDSQCK